MKHTRAIYLWLTMVLTVLVTGSCTNNDDTPRQWFGSWTQTALVAGIELDPDFEPNRTVWEFQNNIVHICLIGEHNTLESSCYGTWMQIGDRLLLDFTHSDDDFTDGTGEYAAPSWLHMPANSRFYLDIKSRKDSKVSLVLNLDDGRQYTYVLKKTW